MSVLITSWHFIKPSKICFTHVTYLNNYHPRRQLIINLWFMIYFYLCLPTISMIISILLYYWLINFVLTKWLNVTRRQTHTFVSFNNVYVCRISLARGSDVFCTDCIEWKYSPTCSQFNNKEWTNGLLCLKSSICVRYISLKLDPWQ